MSVAPYPEFLARKVKLAMAFGDKECYRLSQIQLRRLFQIGHKAGLHKQDMESIFTDLTERMEDAIVDVTALAADVGMPESTAGPILAGMSQQTGLISAREQ